MGPCKDENEALFLRILARMPVDVLILNPNLNAACCVKDTLLYELQFTEALPIKRYPQQSADLQMGTAAYHAGGDLADCFTERPTFVGVEIGSTILKLIGEEHGSKMAEHL